MANTGDQKRFWDEESADAAAYCVRFLESAEKNHWLRMLEQVEQRGHARFSGRILELGGGSQLMSRWLAQRPDCEVLCTDISDKRMTDFTRHYGATPPNLTTRGDVNAERLPFADASFDCIVGDAMLHHIENLRAGLREIRRCLKPGGRAVFIREPVVGHYDFLRRWLRRRLRPRWKETARLEIDPFEYEYWNTLPQWWEEFYRAGLAARVLPGWYCDTAQERRHSRWPLVHTCFVTFVLRDLLADAG